MIDEKVFMDSWALLCERFNREPSRAMALAYYRALSPQMSTDEFQAGANRVFRSNDFFPKPDDFLPCDEDRAASSLDAWEGVHRLMRGFATIEDLDPEARRVVRLLGGEAKLRNTKLDEVQFVRRDFMQMYADATGIARRESRPEIAPSAEARRITGAVNLKVVE